MNFISLQDIPTEINIRGIQSKIIVHHKNATIKNLILKANESIPTHQVPVDVTFFVLEGTGTITIDKDTFSVKKDDTVLCPPNTPMAVVAEELGLSFLNIKTPGIIVTK
ncbi:MAG: cupin domain-containing protein [Tenericutes bacterium]|nr:cupin domain-containing protein [Mycoplasmatota bacterium]